MTVMEFKHKMEIRPADHLIIAGRPVIEVWHEDKFVATVALDETLRAIRVISKYLGEDPLDGNIAVARGMPPVITIMLDLKG